MSERRSKSGTTPKRQLVVARKIGRRVAMWVSAMLIGSTLFGTTAFGITPAHEDVIGTLDAHMALPDDTLLDVAIEHDLGYIEIVAANPRIDLRLPPEGSFIVLPTMHVLPAAERRGIVINLSEMRLFRITR